MGAFGHPVGLDERGTEDGLYITGFGTTNWGNTVGVDTYNEPSSPAGLHSLTVYGRIPSGQFTAAGAYTDTILATITF